MSSLPYESPAHPPELPFADQRGGMKTMGVVLIVIGCFCACLTAFIPMALLAPKMSGQPGPQFQDLVTAGLMYLAAAGVLVTVGAGSLRIRRWSRPIILSITGPWAVLSLVGLLMWLTIGPDFDKIMAAATPPAATAPATTAPSTTAPSTAAPSLTAPSTTAPSTTAPAPAFVPPPAPLMSSSARAVGKVVGLLSGTLLVLLPAALYWFYVRKNVQQTLDYFDHAPCWTDRCPPPVLAMALWLEVGAIGAVLLAFRGILPWFGILLSGPTAVGLILLLGGFVALLGLGMYLVKPIAWWLTVLLLVVGLASAMMTALLVDPLEIYRLSGTPPEQIEMIQRMGANTREMTIVSQSMYGVLLLGYLLFIRKYFRPGGAAISRAFDGDPQRL